MLHDMLMGLAVILAASIFAQGLKVSEEPAAPVDLARQDATIATAVDRS